MKAMWRGLMLAEEGGLEDLKKVRTEDSAAGLLSVCGWLQLSSGTLPFIRTNVWKEQ